MSYIVFNVTICERRKMKNILNKILQLLSSFGLASVLFLLLLILTFLGTLEQIEHGIFDVQKKYFESILLFPQEYCALPQCRSQEVPDRLQD